MHSLLLFSVFMIMRIDANRIPNTNTENRSGIVSWKFQLPVCMGFSPSQDGAKFTAVELSASCALEKTVVVDPMQTKTWKQLTVLPRGTDVYTSNIDGAIVGEWGGSCTCPNGQVYQVGDNHDFCASLACIGGISGSCNKDYDVSWAHSRVECAPVLPPVLEILLSDANPDVPLFIVNPGGSLILEGLTLQRSSGNKGGLIQIVGSAMELAHLVVKSCILNGQNIPVKNGGLIFIGEGSVVNITSSTLKGGKAQNGGALYIHGSPGFVDSPLVNITFCVFVGNSAVGDAGVFEASSAQEKGGGGAAYIEQNAIVNIISSTFQQNTGTNGGALFATRQVTVNIDNTLFEGNEARQGNGGAMVAHSESIVSMTSTIVRGNAAKEWAGGIFVKDKTTLNVNGGMNKFLLNIVRHKILIGHSVKDLGPRSFIKELFCNSICRHGDTTGNDGTEITSVVLFDICPPNKFYDGRWAGEDQMKVELLTERGGLIGCPSRCPKNTVALGFKPRTFADAATACAFCPAGKVFCQGCDDDGNEDEYASCRACELGRVASPGATDCVRCLDDPDKFQDEVEQSTCKLCPAGWTADGTDATMCNKCAAGMYATKNTEIPPRRECVSCPKGTYNTLAAAANVSYCLKCTPGRYLPEQNTEAHEHDQFEDCLNCTASTYNPSYGAGICFGCLKLTPPGAVSCPGACSGKFYF